MLFQLDDIKGFNPNTFKGSRALAVDFTQECFGLGSKSPITSFILISKADRGAESLGQLVEL